MAPFDARRAPFELACYSALSVLGLDPVFGDYRIALDLALLEKLKKDTAAACLTIANLSDPLNINVAIEIGLAYGLGVPCLLTWKRDPSTPVPTDLRGLNYFEYDDEVEIATRLFWGLRPHITWPLRPIQS
jgi:hypothetical protein